VEQQQEWQATAVAREVPNLTEEQLEELALRIGGVVRYDQNSSRLTLVWRIKEPVIKAADLASKTVVNTLVFALRGEFTLEELRLVHASAVEAP
jgi:hypothetical protein